MDPVSVVGPVITGVKLVFSGIARVFGAAHEANDAILYYELHGSRDLVRLAENDHISDLPTEHQESYQILQNLLRDAIYQGEENLANISTKRNLLPRSFARLSSCIRGSIKKALEKLKSCKEQLRTFRHE